MISAACFTSSQRGRMKNTVFGSSNVLIGASRFKNVFTSQSYPSQITTTPHLQQRRVFRHHHQWLTQFHVQNQAFVSFDLGVTLILKTNLL